MKPTLLTSIAFSSVVAVAAGIVFNLWALGLFAAATSFLVLLIATTDYGVRPSYGRVLCRAARKPEAMPLAA